MVQRSAVGLLLALAQIAACTGAVQGPPDATPADGPQQDRQHQLPDGPRPDRPPGVPDSTPPKVDKSPPFACKLPTLSATLKPKVWQHPKTPHAAQTVVLSLQSRISPKPSTPHALTTTLLNSAGKRTIKTYDVAGGKYWIYHIPVAALRAGDNCVVVRRGSSVELARKITAASPAKLARGNGVWKVKSNHQWGCGEQPTYGNLLKVRVLDQAGKPVKGARVNIRWTDDTVYPVKPDSSASSWAAHKHPKYLTTGSDGRASLTTPWGTGLPSSSMRAI